MRRTSIARHSIPSTFFYTSAVYLLIGQNVNKNLTEIDGNFLMDLFGTKPPEIISLGYNNFQKLFFEKNLPQILHFWRPSKLKNLKKISTFQPISRQTADVKKS